MKNSFFAFFLIIVGISCFATSTEEQVVHATGHGVSYRDAVQDALVSAVAQHNGMSIESKAKLSVSQQDSSTTINGDTLTEEQLGSLFERDVVQQLKGKVRRYEIIRCEQEATGEWVAELEVAFVQYKTPGIDPNTRRRIVVVPLGVRESSYHVGDQLVASSATATDLRDGLEKYLVQSRRFSVLGRQDAEAILKEKNLILRESASLDEYAKIGGALGTDYLLCGEIKDLVILEGTTQNPFTNQVSKRIQRARITVAYRILVMPTTQIKWAGEAVVDFSSEDCKAFRGDVAATYEALLDDAEREICAQALGNIYPLRALQMVENGEIVLNQGGALHYEGELLDAYRLGDIIVDAYAKESLGRAETRIATIQIVRVDAKLSYARVVDGDVTPADIGAGIICRPSRTLLRQKEEVQEPDTIKPPTRTEGVRLPFD